MAYIYTYKKKNIQNENQGTRIHIYTVSECCMSKACVVVIILMVKTKEYFQKIKTDYMEKGTVGNPDYTSSSGSVDNTLSV